jgi:hypothetical protein
MSCPYIPCTCPVLNCSFSAASTSFPNHFYGIHQTRTVDFQYDVWFTIVLNPNDQHVVLRAVDMLFLLHHDLNQALRNIVYVTFFGGIHWEEFFSYHLEVKSGQTSLTMETIPPSIQQDDKHSTNFVFIPRPLNAQLKLSSLFINLVKQYLVCKSTNRKKKYFYFCISNIILPFLWIWEDF